MSRPRGAGAAESDPRREREGGEGLHREAQRREGRRHADEVEERRRRSRRRRGRARSRDASRGARAPEEARGQEDDGLHEGENAADRDAEQPERQEQEPDEGVEHQGEEGQRPAQDEQDQPQQELRPRRTSVELPPSLRGWPRVPATGVSTAPRDPSTAGSIERDAAAPPHRRARRRACATPSPAARAAVLVAPPGAGKTTRVPPALVADGPVFLLQPRRVAARSIARRIADEQGWTLGGEVGWQVRFERRFGTDTRLLVATEGVLTRRLQSDPLLSGFRTIVLDEFHERSLHADLALAFARQAWRARDDLRLLVMSATLDAGPVARFLDDCPVIDVPGRPHPIEVRYAPRALARRRGAVGARRGPAATCSASSPARPRSAARRRSSADARRRARAAAARDARRREEQDHALAPSRRAQGDPRDERRRDVAHRRGRDRRRSTPASTRCCATTPSRGLDRLELERIPADSAEQRAGRAGRTGPGRVRPALGRARPPAARSASRRSSASISRGRCSTCSPGAATPRRSSGSRRRRAEGVAAGHDAARAARRGVRWAADAARARRCTACRCTRGSRACCSRPAAAPGRRPSCAVLAEGWRPAAPATRRRPTPTCSRPRTACGRRRRGDGERGELQGCHPEEPVESGDEDRRPSGSPGDASGSWPRMHGEPSPSNDRRRPLLRALLAGFPDRVARRREPGSSRLVLSSGMGAMLGRESGVRDGELLARARGDGRAWPGPASRAARADGEPRRARVARGRADGGRAPLRREPRDRSRAFAQDWYDALLLGERPVPAGSRSRRGRFWRRPSSGAGSGTTAERLRRRLRVAGLEADLHAAVRRGLPGADEPAVARRARAVARPRHAEPPRPPGARAAPAAERPHGRPRLPRGRLGRRRGQAAGALRPRGDAAHRPAAACPSSFELLAPNGGPVQTTRDLRSFWERTYPEVRKELRGRYPRHPWPEDPWTAEPTHRTKRPR